MLRLWLALFGAVRRAELGIGALVPACLLTVRLTFVVFPDSYKTSPREHDGGASWVGGWSGC